MAETRYVIAFAGAIGSGKSKVSTEVAKLLSWPRVSFGDYVRETAKKFGQDPEDRGVLQKLGQALVMSDVDSFVTGVLDQAPKDWREGPGLVVDGVRHAEVRYSLSRLAKPAILRLVLVKVDEDTRITRAEHDKSIEARMLSHYDQDITEAQIARILPAYADIEVDNTLPYQLAAQLIVDKLGLGTVASVAAE
jgi:adenylate kinase family enzyme